jgi:thiosulfate/3-mercaptopyruvate sulfurtransferase
MSAQYAHPEYLAETAWLADHLDDPDLRIFDCTVEMANDPVKGYSIKNGREKYEASHIPGAAFIDLMDEFKDLDHPLNFMMPPADRFVSLASHYGIGDGVTVVLYNAGPTWWATRMWWNLRAHGFDNAKVLNGGYEKWTSEGLPTKSGDERYPAASFKSRPRDGLIVGKDAVLAGIDDPNTAILNALSPELHRGERVQYGRPGHIKSSVNVPARTLLEDETFAFKAAGDLAAAFAPSGVMEVPKVVNYCGGGISATTDLFALALLGHEGVQLYDASMTEWGRDDSLPMETGDT